jgi:hypothetical protein
VGNPLRHLLDPISCHGQTANSSKLVISRMTNSLVCTGLPIASSLLLSIQNLVPLSLKIVPMLSIVQFLFPISRSLLPASPTRLRQLRSHIRRIFYKLHLDFEVKAIQHHTRNCFLMDQTWAMKESIITSSEVQPLPLQQAQINFHQRAVSHRK